MEILLQHHQVAAIFIARVFLGILFFCQGYDAAFRIGIKNVVLTYEQAFKEKGIPVFLTTCASWFTTLAELIGGLLVTVGLFEYAALCVLGASLIVAAVGFGINTPVWDTRFVFPRLVLVVFLLMVPPSFNAWSLDALLFGSCE